MTTTLYAIEGLGGCGKTFLARSLSERGFLAFEEISEVINKEERNKKLEVMPKELRPRFLNEWYLEREIERIKKSIQAINKSSSKNKIIVFDRSIYSQICYVFAQDKYYKTNELNYLLLRLEKLEGIFPNLIYLKCTVDFSLDGIYERNRREERAKLAKGIRGYARGFLEFYKEAYEKILPLLGVNILTINIPEERENLVSKVSSWISEEKTMPCLDVKKIREVLCGK